MLLERGDLLDTLSAGRESAVLGRGSMVLVSGEAGAGKTSLVRAFVDSLDDSTLVISGACDPLTTPRPLSPLYDFAADPGSGLTELATGTLSPFEMFEAVLDRLRNTVRPIVVVIEDIHWADDATLDFLRFIGRRIEETKAMVICTYRDDEVGADHQLRPVLGQLIPLGTTSRITVPALSVEAVGRLAGDRPIFANELHELTDGNAFFVTEVLATGQDLPGSVREAVLARTAGLGESSRRVLEAVSIAPRSLTVGHAMTLVGGSPSDVDEALAAGMLVGDSHQLSFRHELARAAVEESLPPARRLSLHRRMLGLLAEDRDPDIARLAHHAVRSDDIALIVEYAPIAAREASAKGAHKQAISFLEAALDQEREDPGVVADLQLEVAYELAVVGRTEEAVASVEQAIDHYRDVGFTEKLGMALIRLSAAQWRLNQNDKGDAALNEAIELLEPLGPSDVLARAYYRKAYNSMLARKGALGRETLIKAREAAPDSPLADLAWDMRMLDGCLDVVLGDTIRGVEVLRACETSATTPGQVAIAQSMLGSGGGEARLYDDALAALDRSVTFGLRHDEDYMVAYSRSWQARVAHEQGRWTDAVECARLVESRTIDSGIAYITAMTALGRVRVRRGDPGGIELLDEMCELARVHELQHGWNAMCGRAEFYWLGGQPEMGHDWLVPAYERALETDSGWARGEIGFWMWRTGAIDSPPDGAAEPFRLQMEGDWRRAAELWKEIGCPYEVALALTDGDEPAMLEAVRIFDSLGAAPATRMVRNRLLASGVGPIPRGPSRSTKANPAGLTDRQLEVLGLMVHGLSNGEISEELFVSKKTVEHHVSAIYSKLGVRTRARAIAVAGGEDFQQT